MKLTDTIFRVKEQQDGQYSCFAGPLKTLEVIADSPRKAVVTWLEKYGFQFEDYNPKRFPKLDKLNIRLILVRHLK